MRIFKSVLIAAAILAPVISQAQAKIYTKKAKLADFTEKTTNVVLSGDSVRDACLRGEVTSSWRLSPYEFCTAGEYEKLREGSNYFLRFVSEDGILFLRLDKGGNPNDSNTLKRPVEIISIPVASAKDTDPEDLVFLSAYIDIIQQAADKAINTDSNALMSLFALSTGDLKGRTVLTDRGECIRSFHNCETGEAVAIAVMTADRTDGSTCHKMVISCDTHELCYYRRHVISKRRPAGFLPSDIRKINGKVSR